MAKKSVKSFKIFVYLLIFHLCILVGNYTLAQNVNFSQFHLTPLQTNPAMVAASDIANISVIYRSQSVGLGQAFVTPLLSASYPFISKKTGNRWGGIGLTVINDMAGDGGLLRTTGGALAFAYNIRITQKQFLSLGGQGGYFQRSLDYAKITTGSQWTGRTFDPGLDLNDDFVNLNITYPSFEGGFMWYMEDSLRRSVAYLGGSIHQINQPNASFSFIENKIPQSIIAHGGVRVLQTETFSVTPNFRFINQGPVRQINVGSAVRYHFGKSLDDPNVYKEANIGLNAWYSVNNAIILGVEFNHPRYAVSFSYDFNIGATNKATVANGALEFMVGIRKDLGTRRPKKDNIVEPPTLDTTDVVAYVSPSQLTEKEKSLLERSALFTYPSAALSEANKLFLNKIVAILKENEALKLEVSGHACDIGREVEDERIAEKRAQAVYDYLVKNGIDASRLTVKSYGKSRPVASNEDEAGRTRNRRVEFRAIN